MKNALTLTIVFALLFGLTLGCKTGALSRLREPKSKCATNLPALDSAEKYVERAENAITEGNYECALDDCQKVLDADEKNLDALTCRGYVRRKLQDFDGAESDFDEAVKLAPDNPLPLHQRSVVYRETKQFGKALADINKAIELLPTHFYYVSRAVTYTDSGDFENAIKDYTEAIRQKPDDKFYYEDRAAVYRRMGKTDLAEADQKKYEELRAAEDESNRSEPGKDYGAILNDLAISLPKPGYPPAARAVKASGKVKVFVSIDARGNVVSAQAFSGHPLLKAFAEQAVRQAKFKPSAMTGTLVFDFVAG